MGACGGKDRPADAVVGTKPGAPPAPSAVFKQDKAKDEFATVSFIPREEKGDDAAEIERLRAVFAAQKAAFLKEPYPTLEVRIARLKALAGAIMVHRDEMKAALKQDFVTHPDAFSDLIEVLGMVGRIALTCESLAKWMETEERALNPGFYGTSMGKIFRQPKGVILNMAPWNFPFDIGFGPVIEMIAAGNRVVVKPSDLSIYTGPVLKKVFAAAFPGDPVVEVVIGGLALSKVSAAMPWDHILYTGGTAGGTAVARAAAANLVPCTLELGGKCPVIIADDSVADPNCANMVAGVKLIKNGQMCVSSDYVLVPEGRAEEFAGKVKEAVDRMVPAGFTKDEGLVSIISDGHYARLQRLVDDAEKRGAKVIRIGDAPDAATRRPQFSMIIDPPDDALVMKEEIFGPVLPVKTYKKMDDAVAYVNAGERPLSISVFSKDAALADELQRGTVSGGFNVNGGPCMHAAQPQLGFGGIGKSGMGRHHGYEGFCEFSNPKAVYTQGEERGAVDLLLPPYDRPETKGLIDAFVAQIQAGA